jgi:hypothetical protein
MRIFGGIQNILLIIGVFLMSGVDMHATEQRSISVFLEVLYRDIGTWANDQHGRDKPIDQCQSVLCPGAGAAITYIHWV